MIKLCGATGVYIAEDDEETSLEDELQQSCITCPGAKLEALVPGVFA